MLLIVFMFMFASFGVQRFGGRLARCNDGNISNVCSIHDNSNVVIYIQANVMFYVLIDEPLKIYILFCFY